MRFFKNLIKKNTIKSFTYIIESFSHAINFFISKFIPYTKLLLLDIIYINIIYICMYFFENKNKIGLKRT